VVDKELDGIAVEKIQKSAVFLTMGSDKTLDRPISLLTTHSAQGFSSLLLMRVPLGPKPILGMRSPKIMHSRYRFSDVSWVRTKATASISTHPGQKILIYPKPDFCAHAATHVMPR
jgi:hypothetical protein